MKRFTGSSKSTRRRIEKQKLHPPKNKLLGLKQKVTFLMAERPQLRLPDPMA